MHAWQSNADRTRRAGPIWRGLLIVQAWTRACGTVCLVSSHTFCRESSTLHSESFINRLNQATAYSTLAMLRACIHATQTASEDAQYQNIPPHQISSNHSHILGLVATNACLSLCLGCGGTHVRGSKLLSDQTLQQFCMRSTYIYPSRTRAVMRFVHTFKNYPVAAGSILGSLLTHAILVKVTNTFIIVS